MITLHQYHQSPFNQKIQRMLNYKGIAFREKYWGLTQGKKVKQFNPTGKLPALEHEGHWVCDSTDMAHYIEKTFPQRSLIPADPKLAGQVHVLEDWADESLYFYEMRLRFTTPGNQQRNMERMVEHEGAFLRWLFPKVVPGGIMKITSTQGIGRKTVPQLLVDTERHIKAVSDMLGEDQWLVGNQLSLGDLGVYSMFLCFCDADIALALIEKYPSVPQWMERLEKATGQRAPSEDSNHE